MKTQIKGLPKAIVQNGNLVEVWCGSPDGDSSDSQILTVRCIDEAQASEIAKAWLEMTKLNNLV